MADSASEAAPMPTNAAPAPVTAPATATSAAPLELLCVEPDDSVPARRRLPGDNDSASKDSVPTANKSNKAAGSRSAAAGDDSDDSDHSGDDDDHDDEARDKVGEAGVDIATSTKGQPGRRRSHNVEARLAKKERKRLIGRINANTASKSEYYSVFGNEAHATLELCAPPGIKNQPRPRTSLKMRDLHSLVFWTAAETVRPSWAFLKHKPLVERVLVVIIDGISKYGYLRHPEAMPTANALTLPLPDNNAPGPLDLHVPCSLFSTATVLQHFLCCTVEKMAQVGVKDKDGSASNGKDPAAAATESGTGKPTASPAAGDWKEKQQQNPSQKQLRMQRLAAERAAAEAPGAAGQAAAGAGTEAEVNVSAATVKSARPSAPTAMTDGETKCQSTAAPTVADAVAATLAATAEPAAVAAETTAAAEPATAQAAAHAVKTAAPSANSIPTVTASAEESSATDSNSNATNTLDVAAAPVAAAAAAATATAADEGAPFRLPAAFPALPNVDASSLAPLRSYFATEPELVAAGFPPEASAAARARAAVAGAARGTTVPAVVVPAGARSLWAGFVQTCPVEFGGDDGAQREVAPPQPYDFDHLVNMQKLLGTGSNSRPRFSSPQDAAEPAQSPSGAVAEALAASVPAVEEEEIIEDAGEMPPPPALSPAAAAATAALAQSVAASELSWSDPALLRAVDCEMVLCGEGFYALARLTVTDGAGAVLVDALVKPPRAVSDYLTQWSGITAELLATATVTFDEARLLLLRAVRAHHVLVGHSLENDLKALKVSHSRVLDTGILYPHPRGASFRSSLKYLALKHLGAAVQTGAQGHDSVQDALVALALTRLKLSRGADYGSLAAAPSESVLDIVAKVQHAPRFIAPSYVLRRYASAAVHAIPAMNDEEAVDKAIREMSQQVPPVPSAAPGTPGRETPVKLAVLYLPGPLAKVEATAIEDSHGDAGVMASLSTIYGANPGVPAGARGESVEEKERRDPFMTATTMAELPPVPAEPSQLDALAAADAMIKRIWDAVPRNTLVAFIGGQSCVVRERVMSKRAVAMRRIKDAPANAVEQTEALVKASVQDKNQGLMFVNIK